MAPILPDRKNSTHRKATFSSVSSQLTIIMSSLPGTRRPSVVEELAEDGRHELPEAVGSPFVDHPTSASSGLYSRNRSLDLRSSRKSMQQGRPSYQGMGMSNSHSFDLSQQRNAVTPPPTKGAWHGHTAWPGIDSMPSFPTVSSHNSFQRMYDSGANSPVTPWQSYSPWPNSASQPNLNATNASLAPAIRRRGLRFESRLIKKDEVLDKPWLDSKSRKRADRKAYWVFVLCVVLGIAAAAAVVYSGVAEVPTYKYCQLLNEQFNGDSIDRNIWFHEIETGGFGNGQFEWTTNSRNNSYVKDGMLHIVPTLTSDSLGNEAIVNGHTLNLTADGTCTASNKTDASCAVASNATTGVILPPVQSARLITNFSTTIKYGRIEVRARMPTGDWLWPAVWMMPKSSVYGPWPRSGEIDIFESRGNAVKTSYADASNRMHSSLHWGPDSNNDRYLETTTDRQLYRHYFNQEFHTFGLEWTPEGIYTWEQSPIHKVFAYRFKEDFWTKGTFPTTSVNGTVLHSPWPEHSPAAPFDQEFFLILNVAVGGTNGYFDESDKPWSNNAQNPRRDFWNAKDTWYPTWPTDPSQRGMVVDYVKIYQMDGIAGKSCPAGAPVSQSWK